MSGSPNVSPSAARLLQDLPWQELAEAARRRISELDAEGRIRKYFSGGPEPRRLEFGMASGKHVRLHADRRRKRVLKGANKCLAADTMVLRPDGTSTRIADLWPGDEVLAYDPLLDALVPSPVVRVWSNGRKSLVRYVFGRYGTEVAVTATADHKAMVERQSHGKWRRDFGPLGRSGTFRAVRASGGWWGSPEPRALLLSLLIGDGSLRGDGAVQWTCADPTQVAEVKAYVESLGFGLTTRGIQHHVTDRIPAPERIRRDAGGRWAHGGATTRSRLKDWLRGLGLWPAYSRERFVPAEVWTWDRDSVAAFVAGLIASDGSAFIGRTGAKDPHVAFTSRSRRLAEGFKRLLEVRLGIYGSRLMHDPGKGNYQVTYGTAESLRRLADLPVPGRKRAAIRQAAARPVRRGSAASRLLLRRAEPAGVGETYDIEVAHPAHMFAVGGGLIVSNSAKTVAGALDTLLVCAGKHPWRPWRGPEAARVCAPELPGTLDKAHVQRDTIREWCPPHWLRGGSFEEAYSVTGHTLHFANGAFCEFLSYDQEPAVHAQERRTFCVDEQTEILSARGWLTHDELVPGDPIYTLNLATGLMEWKPVRWIYRADWNGELTHLNRIGASGRRVFDALVTDDHRWPVRSRRGRLRVKRTRDLSTADKLLRAAPPGWEMPETVEDDFVKLVAWVLTEGHIGATRRRGTILTQVGVHKAALRELEAHGVLGKEQAPPSVPNRSTWRVVGRWGRQVRELLGVDKRLPFDFLLALSRRQMELFYETLLDGDGHRGDDRIVFTQKRRPHISDVFQAVCVLLGKAVRTHEEPDGALRTWVQHSRRFGPQVRVSNLRREKVGYSGVVWCPNSENGTFVARRNGIVSVTGNCWFDEEPPRPIFVENMARLARGMQIGEWLLTYVPVAGLLWLKEELYDPALRGELPDVGLHEVTIWDNEHNLPPGFIKQFEGSLLREGDRKVRLYGAYGTREGLVFDVFGAAHVVGAGAFEVAGPGG